MKWLSLSRARYTFPNFPLPRGRPMSKSSMVRLRLTGEETKSLSLGVQWTSRARHLLPCTLPQPPSLLQGPARGVGSSSQSHESTLQRHTHFSCLRPTSLPLADTKPKALTRRARWATLDPLQLLKKRAVNAFFFARPHPPNRPRAVPLNPFSGPGSSPCHLRAEHCPTPPQAVGHS